MGKTVIEKNPEVLWQYPKKKVKQLTKKVYDSTRPKTCPIDPNGFSEERS